MGVNNRQRRAAKQRKRNANRSSGAGRPGSPHEPFGWSLSDEPGPARTGPSGAERRGALAEHVRMILFAIEARPASSRRFAEGLVGAEAAFDRELASDVVATVLTSLTAEVVATGWSPGDLGQVARRRLAERHVPVLAGLLVSLAGRHPAERVAASWQAELADLGRTDRLDTVTTDGMEVALGLAAVMSVLPTIARVVPPPGAAPRTADRRTGDHRQQLSKVRALLAKAESTQFAEEAEALSAKAQELISRYALDHLLDEPDEAGNGDDDVRARRLWIDAPYVLPKALLIDAVARANRCSAVVAEKLGFSTVIGAPYDLEAVELLATSLLVQANRAMLGHGSQVGWGGTSRTTAFRRSFLVAYATRIGERLTTATDDAATGTGRLRELVPVLREHAERVAAAQAEMFPRTAELSARVSDAQGWTLGRAAADLARLDVRPAVTNA